MCIGIVPFLMFYYEAWDPESQNWQLWTALKYEFCTILVVGTTLLLMFLFLGYADVPLDEFSYNMTLLPDSADANCYNTPCGGPPREVHLRISVTPAVYIVALVAFVGWFLFTIFVGVGLIAVPMDLIGEYVNRPQPIDLEEYAKQRMLLNERTRQLLEVAQKLGLDVHRRRDRGSTKKFNQFRQAVYFLDKDWNKVKTAYKERGGNPLYWLFCAFLGFLSAGLSIAWYLHILLYVFISPPPTIFLNAFFISLDSVFSLFGTVMYGLFSCVPPTHARTLEPQPRLPCAARTAPPPRSPRPHARTPAHPSRTPEPTWRGACASAVYLLATVLKGCMKVGLRFFWIPIHPMKIGATLMNSFLFNVWLLLLCAVACVQFCFASFQSYAQLTAIDMLLGVQVRNLIGLGWFFQNNFFFYCMFTVSSLTLVYLCAFPTDKRALDDD